jgi:hypothetical protein
VRKVEILRQARPGAEVMHGETAVERLRNADRKAQVLDGDLDRLGAFFDHETNGKTKESKGEKKKEGRSLLVVEGLDLVLDSMAL